MFLIKCKIFFPFYNMGKGIMSKEEKQMYLADGKLEVMFWSSMIK